jgi:hypothetical protein
MVWHQLHKILLSLPYPWFKKKKKTWFKSVNHNCDTLNFVNVPNTFSDRVRERVTWEVMGPLRSS